ncbi:pyridoxamine 5'-phosphate oxidase family protein [Microbacterium sp. SS28]|uniref:pyridoxamine 5'-phosphate oxidase family protein n=1 Tax=Microbacterium sp. SS28 TaxID=2919948 RepID=UPI001FAB1881|nr:pyridoxamine 5'-phosphate oxidase family protein [Microbacterium sp. SS28]
MSTSAHDLSLLDDPVAQQLLASPVLARLAYNWSDGTPRVVPIWFHWDGRNVVVASPPGAPKVKVLGSRPEVAVTIDTETFPYRVLSIRGRAEMDMLSDVAPEYAAAAERYFGEEQGRAWVVQLRGRPMCRIRIVPEWVNILDFETRLPSALSL